MRRMFSENQLIALIQQHSGQVTPEDIQDMFDDGEVSVDGKYVKIYTPAELNAMTDAEFAQLLNSGCFINGQYFGLWNPILYPSKDDTFGHRSYAQGYNPSTSSLDVILTQGKQGIQTIYKQYIGGTYTLDFIGGVNNALRLYGKTYPSYPADTEHNYTLKLVAGVLTWVQDE